MKVTLLNPEQVSTLYYNWGAFSAICYNTPIKFADKIGKSCMNSGHYSGSRCEYFQFKIEDCPRFTVDQLVRHEVGVVKNVQSFRYVNKDNFSYEIPNEIQDNLELLNRYTSYMESSKKLYFDIQNYINNKKNNKERANEQARYVLPMSTHSAVCIGVTVEALIHLCHKRLCSRTEDILRNLVNQMRIETIKVLPDLKDYLVPQCQYLMWCPEEKSCGLSRTKSELENIIQNSNQSKKE